MIGAAQLRALAQPYILTSGQRRLPTTQPLRVPNFADRAWLPSRIQLEPRDEMPPVEVWWGLEDLWIRLHRAGRLKVQGADTLLLPSFRHRATADELGQAVFDVMRYGWRVGLARGSFVQTLHYDGDDLICTLAPTCAMANWPDGQLLIHLRAKPLARMEWSA